MPSVRRTQGETVARTLPQRPKRGFIASYGVGRVCADPECHTALSRYNQSELCYSHAATRESRRHKGLT
jgi:hypothetical protein